MSNATNKATETTILTEQEEALWAACDDLAAAGHTQAACRFLTCAEDPSEILKSIARMYFACSDATYSALARIEAHYERGDARLALAF